MIEIKNLNKKFGKLHILKDISVSCKEGQSIALIGPNGCGKTTVIKCILGMVIPDSGSIEFNGTSIINAYKYRNHIGYMPQIGRYPDNMTIGQVFEMVKEIRQCKDLDLDLYKAYKLNDLLTKKMSTLSGGTTQKVSAALAFMFNPDVLILDEPTAGLDVLASEILKDKIIKEIQKGKLVLITSHLLSELDDLVTQIIFMQDGTIQFHKTVQQLKDDTQQEKISKAIANVLKMQE